MRPTFIDINEIGQNIFRLVIKVRSWLVFSLLPYAQYIQYITKVRGMLRCCNLVLMDCTHTIQGYFSGSRAIISYGTEIRPYKTVKYDFPCTPFNLGIAGPPLKWWHGFVFYRKLCIIITISCLNPSYVSERGFSRLVMWMNVYEWPPPLYGATI